MAEEEDKKKDEDLEETLDWDNYEEIEVGEKETTEVIKVVKGVQKDFRTEKYWEATNLTKEQIKEAKEQEAVEVRTENGASLIINLPQGKKINPRSHLALWKRTYGDFPEEGQEVKTKVDQNGFNRIVLEKV